MLGLEPAKELGYTGVIDDQVLRFKISVSNALLVHVLQGIHHHRAVKLDMRWGQACFGINVGRITVRARL